MSFSAAGSLLFSPFSIRGLRLENRIVLPAMVTRLSGEDVLVNADLPDRYLRFARGEPGLMVLEAMGVTETKSGPLHSQHCLPEAAVAGEAVSRGLRAFPLPGL